MTTEKTKTLKNLRRICDVVLSVWTGLVGVFFIVQVWRIFSIGAKSFTTENISKYFSQIAPFIWLWVAFLLISIILSCLSPCEEKKLTAVIEPKSTLKKLRRRLPNASISENAFASLTPTQKQGVKRAVVWFVSALCLIAFIIVALAYMLGDYTPRATSGFFASHEEAERIVRALPWFVSALCVWIATAYYDAYSVKREITLVKEEIASNAKKGIKTDTVEVKPTLFDRVCAKLPFIKSKWFLRGVRIVIAVLGIGLIVYDVAFLGGGGMADMLEKAVNICTQCIGLG